MRLFLDRNYIACYTTGTVNVKDATMIQCKICNREFSKQITNSHLKTHNVTTAEYKAQYGADSLSCPDYRAEKSARNAGKNNPNYGNSWTEEQKLHLSDIRQGSTPWNKGVIHSDTTVQQVAAAKREQRYRTGELKRQHTAHSDDTKRKISSAVRKYAESNPDEMVQRANKAVATKASNGYYENKRSATIQSNIDTFAKYSITATHIDNRVYNLVCNVCDTNFTRGWGQWHSNMCPGCSKTNATSAGENEVYEFVKSVLPDCTIYQSDRTLLSPFELDILIPDLKIAIEYNGLYWHSDKAGKSKWYHRTKLDKCKEQGYRLIQIFEDEWTHHRQKVKDRLRSKLGATTQVMYARKCKVVVLDKKDALQFIDSVHIQGKGHGVHFYGLTYNSTLVGCMSFSKLNRAKGRTNTPGHYELNRYCSVGNIVGGASRLFSKFIKDVAPEHVITYSDLRWNTGELYTALGFTYTGSTLPGYWYVSGDKRLHRYALRKTDTDPVDLTEYEIRSSQGYYRIWDCGHDRFVWSN